jgi:ATP-dependent DNA ligase
MARRTAEGIRLQTRKGNDYARRYSLIVAALQKLRVSSVILDGEVMCFTGADQDFNKLWNRTHDHEARLCAFDLLELDGEGLGAEPLALPCWSLRAGGTVPQVRLRTSPGGFASRRPYRIG